MGDGVRGGGIGCRANDCSCVYTPICACMHLVCTQHVFMLAECSSTAAHTFAAAMHTCTTETALGRTRVCVCVGAAF